MFGGGGRLNRSGPAVAPGSYSYSDVRSSTTTGIWRVVFAS